jgi:hypothetical protein
MKIFGFGKDPTPPPAPEPEPVFGLPLRKGIAHVVDGERVFYPYAGTPDEPDDVFHPLPLGKHVVNGVLTWVHDPAAGFEVGAP